jgi:hypothetical protein
MFSRKKKHSRKRKGGTKKYLKYNRYNKILKKSRNLLGGGAFQDALIEEGIDHVMEGRYAHLWPGSVEHIARRFGGVAALKASGELVDTMYDINKFYDMVLKSRMGR